MDSRIVLLVCLVFGLSNCEERDPDACPNPKPELHCPLIDSAGHWFEGISNKQTILAQSSKGRAESYDISYYQRDESWGIENCYILFGNHRNVSYSSSLYNSTFTFDAKRIGNIDYLTVSPKYSYYYYYNSSKNIKVNLQKPDTCTLSYIPAQNNNGNMEIPLPVSRLDSIIVKNKTYFNVYKIVLPDSIRSIDGSTKVLYFNGRNGLLQFETFDGEVWSLY